MPIKKPYNVLVLDIDETLVWTEEWPNHDCDFYLDGSGPLGASMYGVKKRPGVDAFLRWCFSPPAADLFRTAIWTAGSALYAQEICEHLLLPGECMEFVWARNRCSRVWISPDDEGAWQDDQRYREIKDLKKLRRAGYDLNRILHLDNTPSVAQRNYGNLIAIPSYNGQPDDNYLTLLPPFLLEWFSAPTVRRIEKRGWWRRAATGSGSTAAAATTLDPYLRAVAEAEMAASE